MDSLAKVVVVDDEPLSRLVIREFVSLEPRFEIVAECDSGQGAIETIRALRPDVVLLDIQMPEVDGFDVLSALDDPLPLVIMVTAYNQHALRAFDHHALDYVLKPIEEARLRLALRRALGRLEPPTSARDANAAERLVRSLNSPEPHRDRITLKCTDTIVCFAPDELPWIEAAGNYVKLEISGEQLLSRASLSDLLRRLDPELFLRIHRSFAVNLDFLVEVKTLPGGSDSVVVLRDGRTLPMGRSFRKAVLQRLAGR